MGKPLEMYSVLFPWSMVRFGARNVGFNGFTTKLLLGVELPGLAGTCLDLPGAAWTCLELPVYGMDMVWIWYGHGTDMIGIT